MPVNPKVTLNPEALSLLLNTASTNKLELLCVQGVTAEDPGTASDFVRQFQHRDWIDGESLVQAGKSPDEDGFNDRFHKIEGDLDALGDNVARAFAAVVQLRAQVRMCLAEIVNVINQANKDATKDTKDSKDGTDTKNDKDHKETKDNKDHKDAPDSKNQTDSKHAKDAADKSDKDHKEKEHGKDALGAAEKTHDQVPMPAVPPDVASIFGRRMGSPDGVRVFIPPSERPTLGERALNAPREE